MLAGDVIAVLFIACVLWAVFMQQESMEGELSMRGDLETKVIRKPNNGDQ